jgi:hypothetical protein
MALRVRRVDATNAETGIISGPRIVSLAGIDDFQGVGGNLGRAQASSKRPRGGGGEAVRIHSPTHFRRMP